MMDELGCPSHRVGIYMSVDGEQRLVGTAAHSRDVPVLLRELAFEWELMEPVSLPEDCVG